MATRDIIVVGGSAGSIDALEQILSALPSTFPAAMLVVLHTHSSSPGYMPTILARSCVLPVAHAEPVERIRPGHVYLAPPDHHLLVERERIRLTRGPKENRSRPAIDPLFRSAAYFHGPRVIGVVLSGMLDDGTAGLWAIKDRGGLSLVQTLDDAQYTSMPESALRHVVVDHVAPAYQIGALLTRLTALPLQVADLPRVPYQLEAEHSIAMGDNALQREILQLGELSPYTCPECHGVLVQLQEGGFLRFRCHTGHAFTANSLLAAMTESIEASLWSAMREVEESVILMQHLAQHLAETGNALMAERFAAKAAEANQRAQQVKQLVLQHEQLSEDQIRHPEGGD